MKKAKQLREERKAKIKAMQALHQAAAADNNRSLTTEERSQWEALNTEVVSIDADLVIAERQEALDLDAAAQHNANTNAQGNRDMSDRDQRDLRSFSLLRGLRLMAEGRALDGVEAEVHDIAVRDAAANGISIQGFAVPAFITRGQTVTGQTTTAGDQGGVTVPTELNGLIPAVWANTWLSAAGARMLTGLSGNQEFMVQESVPTIQELTEIEQMNDTEILFSKFGMSPKRRGTVIPISKQTLLQSSLDIQKLVQDNIGLALGQKLNVEAMVTLLAAITSGTPNNLLALDTNGLAPTYAHIVELESMLDTFETNNSPKYLTNTKVRKKLKLTEKFASTNGQPVWEAGNRLNEYPAVVSNLVPSNLTKGTASGTCSAIVFGDFSFFYVGMWGGADFIIDPYSAKRKGQIEIAVNTFWDTKVARAKSFAGIKDALTV